MSEDSVVRRKISITKYTIVQMYLLAILLLPNELVRITSIYSTETPNTIWYKYLTYHFSALVLPVILLAVFYRKRSQAMRFIKVIIAIFVINIFIFFLTVQNCFSTNHYEMFLILLEGEAICCLFFCFDKEGETNQAERLFEVYFIFAVVTQILRLLLGMSTGGRFGAIGLSVGGTGYLCSIYMLYLLYNNKFSARIAILFTIAVISLILSGQRTCIFTFLLFSLPFFVELYKQKSSTSKRKMIFVFVLLWILLLLMSLLFFVQDIGIKIIRADYIARVFDTVFKFFNGDIGADSSFSGRRVSLAAGIMILIEKPLGISNDFYELQYRMLNDYGYVTFPHSTLLSCVLLWTPPIAVFCLIKLFLLWKKLWRKKQDIHWVILCMIFLFVIWGGPPLSPAQLFVQLFFISLCTIKSKAS